MLKPRFCGSEQVMEDPAAGPRAEGATEEGVLSVAHLKQLLQSIEARRHVSTRHPDS